MAVVAIVATGNVRRVLACRDIAVVTRPAGTDDLRMVNHGDRLPESGGMAVLAGIGRLNMR